jgi:adenosylcobinamide-phosphate synthase
MDTSFLVNILALITGYILDLIFGDPYRFPHPVKGFGWLIIRGETLLNKGKCLILKGALLTVFLVSAAFLLVGFTLWGLSNVSIYAVFLFKSLLIYTCIANKNLIDEGKAVFLALNESLDAGRKRLSYIVGRDTQNLTASKVRIAAMETMSENLSDGVVAPLFYFAVAGVPGMFAYKMVNTLDSMIGYKNSRYALFGKVAARLDDVANFIPARITAFLIALVSLSKRSLTFILKFGNKHSSPNSGFPEAAMAGVLNCRFGGPNYYKGVLVEKPFIGEVDREVTDADLKRIILINQLVTLISIILIIFLQIIFL